MRLSVPRLMADADLIKQDVSDVLVAVGAQQVRAQLLEMAYLKRGAEGGHAAATSSAWSTLLSMDQIPSMPGRHSLLWRDQRCQMSAGEACG